ncbi:hypothetical protein [Lacticaseibacillus kribbianus]|uniref:hypothetical protein n=1 Tax=Lacticaseibacillus kribbianus TaxID=2926292 RepID=UPI001CD54E72|nr:hypothetical protein [Lacticaseibacillus kribbianus]
MKRRLWLIIPLALLVAGGGAYFAYRAGAEPQAEAQTHTVVAKHVGKTVQAQLATRQSTSDLTALRSALEAQLPGVKVPKVNPFGDGVTVHSRAVGSVANYTLYLDRHAAHAGTRAELALKKQTPTSTAAAQTAARTLAYRGVDATKTKVALGNNLTGVTDTEAGHATVVWHQGLFSITVQAPKADPTPATELARNVVSVLAANPLPRPATHGAIVLHVTDGAKRQNTVRWRETSAYYTISGTNPMATLRLAFGVR